MVIIYVVGGQESARHPLSLVTLVRQRAVNRTFMNPPTEPAGCRVVWLQYGIFLSFFAAV